MRRIKTLVENWRSLACAAQRGSEAANRPAQFSIKEYMSQFILCCKINYKCFFAQSARLARIHVHDKF